VRELGTQLHESGGIAAMERVGYFVQAETSRISNSMTLLSNFWNGIGEWLA
jgi:hypothetical protein